MYGVARNSQDVDIDLIQLFRAIWERRKTVLAVTVLAAGVAFAGASSLDRQYKAETRLLIEPRVLAAESAAGGAGLPDELAISSQVQLLQSTDLIKQVARDLKLFDIDEFDGGGSGGILSLIGLGGGDGELAPEERSIKAFRERLTVYQAPGSRVVAIEFSSKDPKLSAEVANKMAEVYLALQSGAKLDTSSDTARWLEPEIANLRDKVREAEKKVADYRASFDLLQTSETSTVATQQLNDISAELTRVRGERASAEARAEHVRTTLAAGGDTESLGEIVAAPVIQRLKEQEATIQSQIADLSTSLLEGHPRLKGLRGQLSGVREQIRAETRRVLASLDNEATVTRLREQQLTAQLNRMKAESARAGESEVELKALEREAAAQRQLLETYLARYREAASRMDPNAAPADARVISRAVEPREAAFPKVVPITIVAALAGFILAAVFVMLAELFSGRALRPLIEAEEEAGDAVEAEPVPQPVAPESAARTGAMARLPVVEEAPSASVIPETETGPVDNEFSLNGVAAAIARGDYDGVPVVAVSPEGDEGSALTVEMARRLAAGGLRVLVMDLTGTGTPTVLATERLDLPGLTDLLTGEAAFSDIIHPDLHSRAHIVPQGTADLHDALRSIERLPMILSALTEAYERVIVECGSVSGEDVGKLLRGRKALVLITMRTPDEARLEDLVGEFARAGFGDVLLLAGPLPDGSDRGDRQAA
ncbi:exopolysaccharide transport family protein [Rhizobiaceae bacterium BDR2-2]|uniref:Exopolysaccharide transport family protein n=1 Tax=Ectorhizobium quercum TaxID=2965071 RepID=A0AAE3N0W4_9HYPH|nr:exopolysaccharide transport family protein [Ectorhizobium quercum]MCX8998958.1 exopolysaccharide transport family protein [Ectorhizobium quercum]